VRVLTISNYFPPSHAGGAEFAAFMSGRGLARRGMDVRILSVNARMQCEVDRYYEWDGLPIHEVTWRTPSRSPFTDVFDLRVYRQTVDEIRRVQPDLVHVHNVSGATLAPFVACRVMDVPVVATLHDSWLLCPNNMLHRVSGAVCDPAEGRGRCPECYRRYDFWGDVPWRRSVLSALVSHIRAFIVPSQAQIEVHVRGGYDRRRFHMIRNGIPIQMPAALTHPGVRHIANMQGKYNIVAFAGGGIEIKGVNTLLRALPMLMRYVERLCVVVAGVGELRYLELLRHFSPTVNLLGAVPYDQMPALYAASDLTLVISTVLENSPTVIYQCQQVGTPVIGSAIGGIPELFRDGETGYLIPYDNPAALAEAIILHFARAPFERRRMRQRCAAFAAEFFDYDQHLDAVSQVYRQAVGSA